MKSTLKRYLALFMAFVMCFSLMPTAAFAEDENAETAEAGETIGAGEEDVIIGGEEVDIIPMPEPEVDDEPDADAPKEPAPEETPEPTAEPEEKETISIIAPKTELEAGETMQLSLSGNIDPADVVWSSSDENVLTVDNMGLVTAISEGNADVSVIDLTGLESSILLCVIKSSLTGTADGKLTEKNDDTLSISDSDYSTYRNLVNKIDNTKLPGTIQMARLVPDGNGGYTSATGICNFCSIETLLNRTAAYYCGDYSNPFDDYDMFNALGISDLGNGIIEYEKGHYGYYLSGGVGRAQSSSTVYKYSDSVSFQPSLKSYSSYKSNYGISGSDLKSQKECIAKILLNHPEGIFLRTEYKTHAIVITDFEIVNNEISLFAIDPLM